jgi:methanogenic corrinoid protein MtbC1
MIESGRHLVDVGAQGGDPAGLRCPPFEGVPVDADPPGSCVPRLDPSLERMRLLVSAVEAQVIPRLVIAHRTSAVAGTALPDGAPVRPRAQEVEACVRLLLDPGAGPIVGYAEDLMARGVSLDSIYLEIFAPAARRLGDMWDSDECTFTDVTIALGRLQQTLRRFSAHFRPESPEGEPWRQALFAAVPGEQHTFGLSMIVQYFLRAGWDATMLPSPAGEEVLRLVQQENIALVGLSMARGGHAPILKTLIGRMRMGSRNPDLRVIVGGFAFSETPNLVAEVGADGSATDAKQAVNLAQQLVS